MKFKKHIKMKKYTNVKHGHMGPEECCKILTVQFYIQAKTNFRAHTKMQKQIQNEARGFRERSIELQYVNGAILVTSIPM